MHALDEVAGIQFLHEFKGQGILLRFLFLLLLGIFVFFHKSELDDQWVWELVDGDEFRGKVMCNLSLEAVLGPIVGRLGQLEDPTLNTPDGNSRGDRDVILEECLLRQLYWEKVGPHLETLSDGAKVRPRRQVGWLDGHLFHAGNELILRLVRQTSVDSRRDVCSEYAAFQMR